MDNINYHDMSDEDFQNHCTALYAEQDRRSKLATIPDNVQNMAQDYQSIGGDKGVLIDKINQPVDDTPPVTDGGV